MTAPLTPEDHSKRLRAARLAGLIRRYQDAHPEVVALVRRGYSAPRITEITGCEPWVARLIKHGGQ